MHCCSGRFIIASLLLAAMAGAVGCPEAKKGQEKAGASAAKPSPLVLLVVDDEELGKAVAREWRGRTEEELTVRDVTPAQILAASRLPGDAILFPSALIGYFAERGLISPLEPQALEDSDFNYRDIFDQIRLGEMRWGSQTMGLSLGSPQLLLVYRGDIFDKLGLHPPTDWAEYQQTIVRLADSAALGELAPSADGTWYPALEPLLGLWAGEVLLARAASYAMHREQVSPLFRFDNMTPLIDQKPYVRALEELVSAAKAGGYEKHWATPGEVFKEIRSGRCGMALTWPVNDITAAESAEGDSRLRFALLPASNEAYRFATKTWERRGEDDEAHVAVRPIVGRTAAITATSSEPRRAQSLVLWLAGREVSQQVSPRSVGTTLFRQSQIATSARWTGSLPPEVSRQYAETLAQSLSLPRGFGLTIPGNYRAALHDAVHQAMEGKPAAAALAEAALQWTAITEKLGLEAQRKANARSLGQAAP
jgi:ABC-type glycerol-3-phosphate transport system substrate-binding protein